MKYRWLRFLVILRKQKRKMGISFSWRTLLVIILVAYRDEILIKITNWLGEHMFSFLIIIFKVITINWIISSLIIVALPFFGIILHIYLDSKPKYRGRKATWVSVIVAAVFIILIFVFTFCNVYSESDNQSTELETPTVTSPAITPWLKEDFSGTELDGKYWTSSTPTCSEEYVKNLPGYMFFNLYGKIQCWMIVNLERNNAEKIDVTIEFPNKEAVSGYSGILASCGEQEIWFVVSGSDFYIQVGNTKGDYIVHHEYVPFTISIILEFLPDHQLKFSWYDKNGSEQLLFDSRFKCSNLPTYVQIGAYTTSESLLERLEVEIEYVEITGSEK